MLLKIIAWLRGEVQSVESLIAGSTTLIAKLEAAAVAHTVHASQQYDISFTAKSKGVAAEAQAAKATTISNKLKEIFA